MAENQLTALLSRKQHDDDRKERQHGTRLASVGFFRFYNPDRELYGILATLQQAHYRIR